MSNKSSEKLLNHLGFVQGNGKISGFEIGLGLCRVASGRKEISKEKSELNEGNWLATMGYFALLDQIGKCFSPRGKQHQQGTNIEKALSLFSDLDADSIICLYGLRNSFMHDFSLFNKGKKNDHFQFKVVNNIKDQLITKSPKAWDGGYANRSPEFTTVVNLREFGELCEKIISDVKKMAKENNLDLLIQEDELENRYMYYVS